MAKSTNWTTVAETKYSWERDALNFVREQFPTHDPYRAWANFAFIADDGSINEVDLLVFTPYGFYIVEIKSQPGRVVGDAGTWTWETEGKFSTVDNPLISANLKAKKLRSLLQRQKVFKKKGQPPFVEALVFCSAPDLRDELKGNARYRVCFRDPPADVEKSDKPGIMTALLRRECPGLEAYAKGIHDRPMAKAIAQAMDQAGIRPSQRLRKVSDYALDQLIDEGPGYQDWLASHVSIADSKRRVRLYLVRTEASADDRATIQRAAQREFQILESLEHSGILRAYNLTEHELGPALLFEHDPLSLRLDHYLTQRKGELSIDVQLDLVRQVAEVVRYAHEKKVIHRGLSPHSVLVTEREVGRPLVKIFNWQLGYRMGTTSAGLSGAVTATSHADRLVEDAATGYMAPEALTDASSGEQLDVFSLGTIAYHIFSGEVPAADAVQLSDKLRETKGLQISAVLNGATEYLQELIRYATHPIVPDRMGSVSDFLELLDYVENELTTPDHDYVDDPSHAQIRDLLPGGYQVVRRLGQGASSVGLLVQRDGQDFILKVANDPDHNERLKEEADLLGKQEMRHACIVDLVDRFEMGRYFGFLMRPVYADKEKRLIETLGQRIRKEGRLHFDLLHRFGEDLLGVVNYLEEQGIPHRDIKPDNITVGMVGRGDKLHLVLFDFSLSRTPAENIRAGTTGYLDPLLPLRNPVRWDLHAERYAAAVTLYEMATGTLPIWGDGSTAPSHLGQDTEITIDAELFELGLREPLQAFFRKAFRRKVEARFDNAEDMLRSWRQSFEGLDESGPLSDHADEATLQNLLADVTYDTHITELGLGTRATNALDRANLLTVSMRRLLRLRGVGNKTRREIATAVKILRERLGRPQGEPQLQADGDENEPQSLDAASLSIDLLADRLRKAGSRDGETFQQTGQLLLGLASDHTDPWPSQSRVAEILGVTRARIGQVVGKLQERWSRDVALTPLRPDLQETLRIHGGVMSARELSDAVLVARGSTQDEPLRSQLALAVVRAATEVERTMADPRFVVRRDGDNVLVGLTADLTSYALRLGEEADTIAQEDPLVAPARVIERLRQISAPHTIPLTDLRLVRIAAEASTLAAVSSRQEIYPMGMGAARALKLSQGALLGQTKLTVEQIQDRVSGRYPEAAPLPEPPALDELLRQAGFDFQWDPSGNQGVGCYVSPLRGHLSVTSGTESSSRQPTWPGKTEVGEVTPEEADKRFFEERLTRSIQEGSFLSLLVNPRNYDEACGKLCRRFPLQLVDFEGLFLDSLQQITNQAKVQWDLVLQTDAQPQSGDWDKLMMLVGRAMPIIQRQLEAAERTILLIYPGLLARYGQMDLLSRLSQKVGRKDGIPGLWLLLPGDNQALIDGKPVPLIGPGQKTRIPASWLWKLPRANAPKETTP